jgi:pantetheine-phosphate adenylyltransferase
MTQQPKRIAVFPGAFDPITNGHVDVIRRGAKLFDELIVAVGENPDKASLMDPRRRAEAISQVVAGMDNVRVEVFQGLTVDFARRMDAAVILRGVRNSSDLEFESRVAMTNRAVTGVETVFLIPSPEYAFTSSSLIRQIASMGGDVSTMVPPQVLPYINSRDKQKDDPSIRKT